MDGYYDIGDKDCKKCHYSCKTCLYNNLPTDCSSCDMPTNIHRLDHSLTISTSCPCEDGYFDENLNPECKICKYFCKTCITTDSNCLSCDITPAFNRDNLPL